MAWLSSTTPTSQANSTASAAQVEAAEAELEAMAVTLRQVEAHNTHMQSEIAVTRRHAPPPDAASPPLSCRWG